MASGKIRGVTIELGADTKNFTDALKNVDKSLSDTQRQLKDVNKLLKLDPKNTELLAQKQELLTKAVDDSKTKLDSLNKALSELKESPNADKTIKQQQALEREIVATENALKNYQTELKNTKPLLDTIGTTAEDVAKKTKTLSKVATGVAVAFVGNAVNSAKVSDELATLSRNTGISVEELQKMQYASELVDVSIEDMTGSYKKLLSKMGSGSKVFKKLGVSTKGANGQFRNAEDVWYDCLKALSEIEDETERDIVAQELFGKSASELSGIIDDGGEALKKYGDEAEEMGLIMSEDVVNGAVEMSDQIDKMKGIVTQSFIKMGASLSKTLVPMLEKLMKVVEKVCNWFSNLDGDTQTLIVTIALLVASISPVATAVSKVIKGFKALSNLFTVFSNPVGLAVLALGALVTAGVLLYKNWATIRQKANDLWDKFKTVFGKIQEYVSGVWDTISTKASNVWETITTTLSNAWDGIKTTASTVWDGIKTTVTNVWDSMKTTASTVWETIKTTITSKFTSAKDTISSLVDTIKEKISGIVQGVKNIFDVSNWTLPTIKLPHFKVTGKFGWSWDGGLELPKISVEWYKKAMQGMTFKNPTLFGFGDGGAETVVGTNNLMSMIRKATAEGSVNYGGVNVVINVDSEITGKRLLDEIETELANRTLRRKAVFG